jgi:hypothetical protein
VRGALVDIDQTGVMLAAIADQAVGIAVQVDGQRDAAA